MSIFLLRNCKLFTLGQGQTVEAAGPKFYLSAKKRCELFTLGQQGQTVEAAGFLELGQILVDVYKCF
jgi:hypothetical protein